MFKYLKERGYRVIPINPGLAGQTLLVEPVLARLSDLAEPVDMVEIFRNSDAAGPLTDEALALDPLPKVIWMQLSVRNDAAAARAEARGVTVIMNRCPKIEYGRISGEIGWQGINSRILSPKRSDAGAQGLPEADARFAPMTGGAYGRDRLVAMPIASASCPLAGNRLLNAARFIRSMARGVPICRYTCSSVRDAPWLNWPGKRPPANRLWAGWKPSHSRRSTALIDLLAANIMTAAHPPRTPMCSRCRNRPAGLDHVTSFSLRMSVASFTDAATSPPPLTQPQHAHPARIGAAQRPPATFRHRPRRSCPGG